MAEDVDPVGRHPIAAAAAVDDVAAGVRTLMSSLPAPPFSRSFPARRRGRRSRGRP